jgi:hypothetical protein
MEQFLALVDAAKLGGAGYLQDQGTRLLIENLIDDDVVLWRIHPKVSLVSCSGNVDGADVSGVAALAVFGIVPESVLCEGAACSFLSVISTA